MHSARSDGRSRGGQGGPQTGHKPRPRRRLAVTHGRRRVVGWTSTDLDYFGSGITDLPSWYSARLFVNGFVNGTPREAIERVRQTVTGRLGRAVSADVREQAGGRPTRGRRLSSGS